MALYLVAYDLTEKSQQEYQGLWDELDSLVSIKTQESVYLVSSRKTQEELFDLLKGYIHGNDRLMVVEINEKPSYRTALPGTDAWLEGRFSD